MTAPAKWVVVVIDDNGGDHDAFGPYRSEVRARLHADAYNFEMVRPGCHAVPVQLDGVTAAWTLIKETQAENDA